MKITFFGSFVNLTNRRTVQMLFVMKHDQVRNKRQKKKHAFLGSFFKFLFLLHVGKFHQFVSFSCNWNKNLKGQNTKTFSWLLWIWNLCGILKNSKGSKWGKRTRKSFLVLLLNVEILALKLEICHTKIVIFCEKIPTFSLLWFMNTRATKL
jgi:hypothetical protein